MLPLLKLARAAPRLDIQLPDADYLTLEELCEAGGVRLS
jgi:hypothetical protein